MDPIVFDFDLNQRAVAMIAAAFFVLLLTVTWYRRIILRPARRQRSCERGREITAWPGVSVIVLARDNAGALERMLPGLLGQVYPVDYEVVVVNDGGTVSVTQVVARFCAQSKNLRETFVPLDTCNLSRRKLGITLGIKAARYPYVIILDADCRIGRRSWLKSMARHFAMGKEVVIGFRNVVGNAGAAVRVDNLIENVTWLTAAVGKRPYRACESNLGYSRKLFFDHKGFARSLNLHGGDDDLFIDEVANGDNTAVELSEASIVRVKAGNATRRYHDERLWHAFTGRMLTGRFRRYVRLLTALLWVTPALCAVAAVLEWPNVVPALAVFVIMILQWTAALVYWKRTATALGYQISYGGLLWGLAVSPFYAFKEWIRCRRNKEHNYTWSISKRR
ncbi:MAG: glycosyltransferase [Muribaculaceae bacterium]|nr:glycosyltransferase [Muribaculaceae bacterium]